MARITKSFIFWQPSGPWAILALCLVSLGQGCARKDLGSEIRTINGRVSSGSIQTGRVAIYALNPDDSRGVVLAESALAPDGSYAATFRYDSGPVEVVIDNGTYVDPASGAVLPLGPYELSAIVDHVDWDRQIAVTPLTDIAAVRARVLDEDFELADAIRLANSEVAAASGLKDIVGTLPDYSSMPLENVSSEEAKYGLVLSSMSQLVKSRNWPDVQGLVSSFSEDFSDGVFDGLDVDGSQVLVDKTSDPLSASVWSSDLMGAENGFIVSPSNVAGFSSATLTLLNPAP